MRNRLHAYLHVLISAAILVALVVVVVDVHKGLVAGNSFIAETKERAKMTDEVINANLLQASLILGRVETASRDIPALQTRLSATLRHADAAVVGLGVAEASLSKTITDLGTDSHAVLADAGSAILEGQAAITEGKNDLARGGEVIASAGPLVKALTDGSQAVLGSSDETIKHLDRLVVGAEPIESSFAKLAVKADDATGQGDEILRDFKDLLNDFMHPKHKSFMKELAVSLLGPSARVAIDKIADWIWPERVILVK